MIGQLSLFERPITNSGIDEENFFLINAIMMTSSWDGEWCVVYVNEKKSDENYMLVDRCGQEEANRICECKNVYKKEVGMFKVVKTSNVKEFII